MGSWSRIAATALSNAGAKSLSSSEVNDETNRMSIGLHTLARWRLKNRDDAQLTSCDDFAIVVPRMPTQIVLNFGQFFDTPRMIGPTTAQKLCARGDFWISEIARCSGG